MARTVKSLHARVVIAVACIACFASSSAWARDVLPLTCDARATISAVEKMALLAGDGVAVKLLAPAQAGVAAAEGQRGCVGTLIVDGERIAHAWVIAPDPQRPIAPYLKPATGPLSKSDSVTSTPLAGSPTMPPHWAAMNWRERCVSA